jgi:hypothetical protein
MTCLANYTRISQRWYKNLFLVSTLNLSPQVPVVTKSFRFLVADGKFGAGGGVIKRVRGCQLNSSSVSSVCNISRFQNKKLFLILISHL